MRLIECSNAQSFPRGRDINRFGSTDTIAEVSGFGLHWRSSCALLPDYEIFLPRNPLYLQPTLPTPRPSPPPQHRPYSFLQLQLTSPITASLTSNLSQPSIITPNPLTLASSSVKYTHQITSRLLYRIPAPARFSSKSLVYITINSRNHH